ncbi:MAG TPA: hypothetical protein VMH30_09880 [Verrucomicrobiae bacterium]|nr:hypothetical protein [Verrucomicrobiae bacterium]
MRPEKQQLIDELLEGESRREATLLAGAKVLRRRRHWRAAGRIFVVASVAIVAVLAVEQRNRPPAISQISVLPGATATPVQARSLTDEELLALFPNTPVGLATLPNGKKVLIFPRPGDEARYVGKF